MINLTKKNKKKKSRITEEEVESMSEEDELSYYEDGYVFDSISSDITEEDIDELTKLEDKKSLKDGIIGWSLKHWR